MNRSSFTPIKIALWLVSFTLISFTFYSFSFSPFVIVSLIAGICMLPPIATMISWFFSKPSLSPFISLFALFIAIMGIIGFQTSSAPQGQILGISEVRGDITEESSLIEGGTQNTSNPAQSQIDLPQPQSEPAIPSESQPLSNPVRRIRTDNPQPQVTNPAPVPEPKPEPVPTPQQTNKPIKKPVDLNPTE